MTATQRFHCSDCLLPEMSSSVAQLLLTWDFKKNTMRHNKILGTMVTWWPVSVKPYLKQKKFTHIFINNDNMISNIKLQQLCINLQAQFVILI
jgi:hypothetical protein